MKCPKCGHKQAGTVECEACGLVFEKYRRYLEMSKEDLASNSAEPKGTGGWLLRGAGVVAMLLVLIGGYLWFRGGDDNASPVPSKALTQTIPTPSREPETVQNEPADTFAGLDLATQLNKAVPPGNPIEQARNSTVFIQAPWGQGAGFFIDEDCSIVTNRHVVKLSEKDMAKAKSDINRMKNQAETLRAMIKSNKDSYDKILNGKARLVDTNITLEEFEKKIKYDDEKLNEYVHMIEKAEQELEQIKWDVNLSIILADGTKLEAWIDHVSDEHDLALVRPLGNARCPAIPLGDSDRLSQGDQLFTVGSPMGIRHVVTSGIFSGSIQIGGKVMLQTDAPINPGNSGGPLLDQSGKVVGINTMVMDSAQGIGFAIPIKEALQVLPVARN